MPDFLTQKAVENSTYSIAAAFSDSAGNAVVPNSLTWSLADRDGTIINSREDVAVETPAATVTIVLYGDDLELADPDNAARVFLIKGDYDDPDLGDGLPIAAEICFEIEELIIE